MSAISLKPHFLTNPTPHPIRGTHHALDFSTSPSTMVLCSIHAKALKSLHKGLFNNNGSNGCPTTQFRNSPEPSVGSLIPNKGGGMPFINSNPAVPLPTGEVDSATIRPIPTSGHQGQVLVGLFAAQMALFCVVLLML
ncbi:hypothetical protein M0R45_009482 [Rubus argutus]|uniref:Uncharacterized protein n=1 Tax=Rubus argutus TaxID=59490 RepID=A0AAW1Y819_RUBAR